MNDRHFINAQQKCTNQNEFDQMQFQEEPENFEKPFRFVEECEQELQHLEWMLQNDFDSTVGWLVLILPVSPKDSSNPRISIVRDDSPPG